MEIKDVASYFCDIMKHEKEVSAGVATIRALLKFLQHDDSETVQELVEKLKTAVVAIRNTDFPVTAVASGSELFLRFITLASLDVRSFSECKNIMLHRGEIFLKKLMESRKKLAKFALTFIFDKARILTHSKSRAVLEAMKLAAEERKRFEVFVTISSPDNSGEEMAKELRKLNIKCTIILDSAIGYIMEQVDMVMVGAEGVAESGGIINKVGTYTIAVCAIEMKKPLYVLAESFKFSRICPLNQRDIPVEFKYKSSQLNKDLSEQHPLVDYTPPQFINLLFTDLGILAPSAVSDELIMLYL